MRSLSRTWPPVTDRYARMRKRAATVPNAEQLRAEFEQAWAEIVSVGPQTHRLIVLPTGSMRRPTRADRRCKRMRAHTSLTLEAATRHQRIRTWRCRVWAGVVSPAELRADLGLPTFPGGETASERMGRLLRWAGFDKPRGPVEVTYTGPEFPKLDSLFLADHSITPLDVDDLAQVDLALEAANRLIEDHCAPNPDTDPEQDPHV